MTAQPYPEQTWPSQDSIVFCRTRDPYGHFSNMASGYPLDDSETGLTFQSSEGLYQAAKFPHDPARQRRIAAAKNAYMAKQIAYEPAAVPEPQWEAHKVAAMRRALQAKLTQHPQRFGALLRQSGRRPIVEYSSKGDRFWGAAPAGPAGQLQGRNVLGCLLMELRQELLNAEAASDRPVAAPAAAGTDPESQPTTAAAPKPADPPADPNPAPRRPTFAGLPRRDQVTMPRSGGGGWGGRRSPAEFPAAPAAKAKTHAASNGAAGAAVMAAAPAAPRNALPLTQSKASAPAAAAPANPAPYKLGDTAISALKASSLLSPGTGFMSEYHGSLNPYSGCTFGCGYCYAANFTRSEQEQDSWGKWVKVKANLDALLDALTPGEYNGKVLYMSTVTDPYQPLERQAQVTRHLLTRLVAEHPQMRLVVQTRSPLVNRDQDLFHQLLAAGGKVQVNFTVTTDSEAVRKAYEPGCPSIPARLKAATAMRASGIPTAITATPMLPLENVESFLATLRETGVTRYIIQPFKLPAVKGEGEAGKFVARTDRKAVELTRAHYGLPEQAAAAAYQQEYRRHRERFRQEFPDLGEGKDGFQPPWPSR